MGMPFDEVTKLLEYGILGGVVLISLFAIIRGVNKAATWVASELMTQVVLPIKKHLIEHLDKTGNILEAIQKTNESEQTERHQVLRTLTEHTEAINRIDRNVEAMKKQAGRYFDEQHAEHEERPKHSPGESQQR